MFYIGLSCATIAISLLIATLAARSVEDWGTAFWNVLIGGITGVVAVLLIHSVMVVLHQHATTGRDCHLSSSGNSAGPQDVADLSDVDAPATESMAPSDSPQQV